MYKTQFEDGRAIETNDCPERAAKAGEPLLRIIPDVGDPFTVPVTGVTVNQVPVWGKEDEDCDYEGWMPEWEEDAEEAARKAEAEREAAEAAEQAAKEAEAAAAKAKVEAAKSKPSGKGKASAKKGDA